MQNNSLAHYGVLGMKWGQRRAQSAAAEKAYRRELTNISKIRGIKSSSDYARVQYRNKDLSKRIGQSAAQAVKQEVVKELFTLALTGGDLSRYQRMNAKDIGKRVAGLAGKTLLNVAVNDALAKSVTKKYTDNGTKRKFKGAGTHKIQREDVAQVGIGIAVRLAPFAFKIADMKMAQFMKNYHADQERMNRWGDNFLPQKVSNVVWRSEDGTVSVIED